jgi:hypothetical protein
MPSVNFGLAAYERQIFGLPMVECVNLYPEQTPTAKSPASLLPTPGLEVFANVGSGGIAGLFQRDGVIGGTCIAITKDAAYTVARSGAVNLMGDITAFSGGVRFAGDDDQLVLVTGNVARLIDGANISTLMLGVVDVAYLNSRFLFITADGKMKFSTVTDAETINALDFVTAESAPDGLKAILVMNGEVYLAGADTTEIWTNTTSAADPFQRRPGGVLPFGCASRDACIIGPDKAIWMIGNDRKVYHITNGGVEPVNNPTIGGMLDRLADTDLGNICAWGYATGNHRFVGFDLPGIATMVYDIDTGAWAQRRTFGRTLWAGYAVERCFGNIMVGSRDSAAMYRLSESVFTENGGTIERVATTYVPVPERTPIDSLTLYARRGVGNANVASPQVMMSISKDGGRTFGTEEMRGLGATGAYQTRTIWRRLGRAKQDGVIFKLRVTDPCSAVFTGADFA